MASSASAPPAPRHFVNLVPVFAVLQAAILLDERLGLPVLGGGLLVIAGVWLTTNSKGETA
jgi:drug/metabolite transporter (DMT)-like permease